MSRSNSMDTFLAGLVEDYNSKLPGVHCVLRVTLSYMNGIVPTPDSKVASTSQTYYIRNVEMLGAITLPTAPFPNSLIKLRSTASDKYDNPAPAVVTGQLIYRLDESQIEVLSVPNAQWPLSEEQAQEWINVLRGLGFCMVPVDRMTTTKPDTQYTCPDLDAKQAESSDFPTTGADSKAQSTHEQPVMPKPVTLPQQHDVDIEKHVQPHFIQPGFSYREFARHDIKQRPLANESPTRPFTFGQSVVVGKPAQPISSSLATTGTLVHAHGNSLIKDLLRVSQTNQKQDRADISGSTPERRDAEVLAGRKSYPFNVLDRANTIHKTPDTSLSE